MQTGAPCTKHENGEESGEVIDRIRDKKKCNIDSPLTAIGKSHLLGTRVTTLATEWIYARPDLHARAKCDAAYCLAATASKIHGVAYLRTWNTGSTKSSEECDIHERNNCKKKIKMNHGAEELELM